jgi:hypothetical protein
MFYNLVNIVFPAKIAGSKRFVVNPIRDQPNLLAASPPTTIL